MEARFIHAALIAASLASLGAGYRTANFVIEAPTPALARQIGDEAERFRHELAVEWLGKEMPNWSRPCLVRAQVAPHLGAGGATTFVFDNGEVFGWRMEIQGPHNRLLDSVLPHEVTHTIFASHFRCALPRWADEGACTTVEHPSERARQKDFLIEFLKTGRGISFSRMMRMKEYPRDVLPLYSQGYSLARYLIAQGGKKKFLEFLADGMRDENWQRAVHAHYGQPNLFALQNTWLAWVRRGSPELKPPQPELVAAAKKRSGMTVRAQSKDRPGGGLVAVKPTPRPEASAPRAAPDRAAPAARQASPYVVAARQSAARAVAAPAAVADRAAPAEAADKPRPEVLFEWNRPAGKSPAARTSSLPPATRIR